MDELVPVSRNNIKSLRWSCIIVSRLSDFFLRVPISLRKFDTDTVRCLDTSISIPLDPALKHQDSGVSSVCCEAGGGGVSHPMRPQHAPMFTQCVGRGDSPDEAAARPDDGVAVFLVQRHLRHQLQHVRHRAHQVHVRCNARSTTSENSEVSRTVTPLKARSTPAT